MTDAGTSASHGADDSSEEARQSAPGPQRDGRRMMRWCALRRAQLAIVSADSSALVGAAAVCCSSGGTVRRSPRGPHELGQLLADPPDVLGGEPHTAFDAGALVRNGLPGPRSSTAWRGCSAVARPRRACSGRVRIRSSVMRRTSPATRAQGNPATATIEGTTAPSHGVSQGIGHRVSGHRREATLTQGGGR
jgi:hypothetical protein